MRHIDNFKDGRVLNGRVLNNIAHCCLFFQLSTPKVFLTFVLVTFHFLLNAQRTISGTVSDDKGAPLQGVSVALKNTKTTVISNNNGVYRISTINDTSKLVFSYVGFKSVEESIRGRQTINVTMLSTSGTLGQVVVVGYGSQRKADLTGSLGTLISDEIQRSAPVSLEQAMKGKIAGVQVQNSDGAPGAGINIKIRGASSITAGSSPLYVIDGFPVPITNDPLNNPLSTLAPDVIESITILKDVSSTAIYGAQGANGVVLVTTKKAREGTSELAFKATVGVSNLTKRMEMLDDEGYMRAYMLEQVMSGRWQNADFYQEYKDQIWKTDPSRFTDYQKLTLKKALRREYELSYLGGTNTIKNTTTMSLLDDDGTAINTGFTRYYFRSNTNVKVSSGINIQANISYENSDRKGLNFDLDGSDIFNKILTFSPLIPKEWTFQDVDNNIYYTGPLDNPYRLLKDIDVHNRRTMFTGQMDANIKLMEGLNLSGGIGIRLPKNNFKEFVPQTIYSSYQSGGQAKYQTEEGTNLRYFAQLSYNKLIHSNHMINFGLVGESNRNTYQLFRQDYTHFNTDLGWQGIYAAQSGTFVTPPIINWNEYRILSGIAFGNYTFKNRYLFKASLRADASSKFGPKNRSGIFPSGAVGWRISDEKFFQASQFLSKVVSNAKLRISYGQVGNDQIPDYLWASTLSSNDRRGVFLNISDPNSNGVYNSNSPSSVSALVTSKMANENVGWETTKEFNYGLDLGLFDNRLNVTVDYYHKKTVNMLLNQSLPMTTGFASVTKNIGSIRNNGIELNISGSIIKNRNFTWDASFNISANRSKVLNLGESNQMIENRYIGDGNSTQNVLIKEGLPLGLLYGLQVEGIRPNWNSDDNAPNSIWWYGNQREAPYGWISFADINGDGTTDLNDRTVIGYVEPTFIGGFNQVFTYKFLDLSMNLSGSYGNDIINANYFQLIKQSSGINNKLKIMADAAWFGNNQSGTLPGPGPIYWMGYQNAATVSEIVEDGSFLKLNNISLGINLPDKLARRIRSKGVKLTYTITNVHTWTRYSGYDPEVSSANSRDYNTRILSGVDFSSYPYSRTHSLTLSAKF